MSDQRPSRASFMTGQEREVMKGLPRTHQNCTVKTGRARPGKTAHDKATGAYASFHERRDRKVALQAKIRKSI